MADGQPRHLAAAPARARRRGRARLLATLAALGIGAASVAVGSQTTDAPGPAVDRQAPPATGAPPSTTSSTSTSTTQPPLRSAVLAFGGDVLIHRGVWEAAATTDGYDFSPMLDPIAPLLSAADLALCHLEVTLGRPGERLSGYPRFRAPAPLAADLAEAGFDGCSVASNHALDHGESGIVATLDALDAAGLGHAGTARSPEEDRAARIYDAGGIAVGHLSYAYGFNGLQPPTGKEWLVDPIDPNRILADATALRAAGAELVVVSLHWGDEYAHDVTAAQQEVAGALDAAPGTVDLVVGHHAHVVQPIAKVGDLWVVWGLGNLLSNNSPACCTTEATDGLVVTVAVGEREDRSVAVRSITYTPTWNERSGYRVLPAAETLAAGVDDPALAEALRAAWARTDGHVRALDPEGTLALFPSAVP